MWLPLLLGGPSPTDPIATPIGPSITYTGADLVVGGTADVRIVLMRPDGRSYDEVRISDEQVLSCQPNGAMELRPPGTAGGYERGVVKDGCATYNPLGSDGVGYVFALKAVPNA